MTKAAFEKIAAGLEEAGEMEAQFHCEGCRFAVWKKTAAGRLHPGKSGRCTYLAQNPINFDLPASFYWLGRPIPGGGQIERGSRLREACKFRSLTSDKEG